MKKREVTDRMKTVGNKNEVMENKNRMHLEFDSKSENEGFARVAVAAFISGLNPTIEEIEEIRTAVSEAVTNCVIHGYKMGEGIIIIDCEVHNNTITICIKDYGVGIEDIEKAKEPLFTTCEEEERSGMGFAFMEMFMDSLVVESSPSKGTAVIMKKSISNPY